MKIKMQEYSKNYDASLFWNLGNKCNLNCSYCIAKEGVKNSKGGIFIDIPALLKVLDNTHKTINIFLTGGGEPFLASNFVEACVAITKKHYISLVTNLTQPQVKEFAASVNPKRVIYIRVSAHIKELEKRELFDTFFSNILLLQSKGFRVAVIEVAHPSLFDEDEVEKYKKFFIQKGIKLEFSAFIGKYNNRMYPQSYTEEEIKIFGFNPQIYYRHKKICNAGYNTVSVDPSGIITPCFQIRENIGNIYKKIEFKKNLVLCPVKMCLCPLDDIDPYLFKRALDEVNTPARKINFYFLRRLIDSFFGKIGIFLKNNFPKSYHSLKKIKE